MLFDGVSCSARYHGATYGHMLRFKELDFPGGLLSVCVLRESLASFLSMCFVRDVYNGVVKNYLCV